jgi:hypothetical protein
MRSSSARTSSGLRSSANVFCSNAIAARAQFAPEPRTCSPIYPLTGRKIISFPDTHPNREIGRNRAYRLQRSREQQLFSQYPTNRHVGSERRIPSARSPGNHRFGSNGRPKAQIVQDIGAFRESRESSQFSSKISVAVQVCCKPVAAGIPARRILFSQEFFGATTRP